MTNWQLWACLRLLLSVRYCIDCLHLLCP
jgi:hypothetical protein